MREKYLFFFAAQSWKLRKKIEFYKTFKDEYSTTDYLYQLRHYDEWQHFVKFKISNHKLLIEQGRYQIDHLSREHRSGRRWDSFLLPKKKKMLSTETGVH